MSGTSKSCVFCGIARSSSTNTSLLYSDDRIVAFRDINPAAFRHYLVIPVQHIPTTNDLQRGIEDYQLVNDMLHVGKTLLLNDAPNSVQFRYGFHRPPFNSVNHLHLHCLAPPFIPRWRELKYMSMGSLGGFLKAEEVLEKIKPANLSSS